MGAWEVGNFGNDDASDWVDDLEDASGTKLLIQAFAAVEKTDYAESPDCCVALAAAETIATTNGHPPCGKNCSQAPEQVRVTGFVGGV